MKKQIALSILLLGVFWTLSGQIGIFTDTPSSVLDIRASNQADPASTDGLLIPRIDAFPITPPGASQNGMLVFLTSDKRFYFWHQSTGQWVALTDALSPPKIDDLADGKSDSDGTDDGSSIYLGIGAGQADDASANRNVGIGYNAMYTNTIGFQNTAVGHQALRDNLSQGYNTGIGAFSLSNNYLGANNTALGSGSLFNNINGGGNTGIGKNVLYYNSYGNYNVALGFYAMQNNTLGKFNVGLGANALNDNTIGDRNIALGYDAGNNITTGSSNIIIGESVLADDPDGSYQLNIGDLVKGNLQEKNVDIQGSIQLASTADDTPPAGTIRWNATLQDFEGYTGTEWKSLTFQGEDAWGTVPVGNPISEDGSLTSSDGSFNDFFGYSIALDGDYIVIGAFWHDTGGNSNQGKAYIFYNSGGTWAEQAILTASDGLANHSFGYSVDIDGDYVVIGATGFQNGLGDYTGKAYVFIRSGTSWSEQAGLIPSDGGDQDKFGRSVAIDGDLIIVGADYHDIGGNLSQGKAYVYLRSGTSWSEEAILTASDGSQSDRFGFSVDISGDRAMVGAPYKNVSGLNDVGKAYIFLRSGGSWSEETSLEPSGGTTNCEFGTSVGIEGVFAVCGANGYNAYVGGVFVFHLENGNWAEQAILEASDPDDSDLFGYVTAISGDFILVGAPYKDVGSYGAQGMAYLFHRVGEHWSEQAVITSSDGYAGDQFGEGVCISSSLALIGASRYDVGANPNQGKVYLFEK